MNKDVMEELGDIYKVAFRTAHEVVGFAEEKAATEITEGELVMIAQDLFHAYNKRTERVEKADPTKIGEGNNSDRPVSIEQIKLIKTVTMEAGIKGEKKLKEMQATFGFEELEELNMGDAHMVIDAIKSTKKKR